VYKYSQTYNQHETEDVQLKSVSLKQTDNSHKIESVRFTASILYRTMYDIVEDEDVDIESICSDISETISQISIDMERKLSLSDFQQLLPELKGFKKKTLINV